MARNIQFDAVSLNDNSIVIKEAMWEDVTNRHINYQKITGRDGMKFVDDEYIAKRIVLTGIVKDATAVDLDDRIDDLKELLSRKEKNLDIEYISGTRRFIASCTNFQTERDHFNLTFVPITIEFTISNPPHGKDISETTTAWTTLNDTIAATSTMTASERSVSFGGTRRPLPTLQFTINSCSSLSEIRFINNDNGDWIKVTERFYSDSDVLVIDCDGLTVKLNGIDHDYNGVFPEFETGWNDFEVKFRGRAYNVTLEINYTKLWL